MNELEQRIAEASESAVHGGRTAMAKLESKVKELEIELSGIQTRTNENSKMNQKADRKIKVIYLSLFYYH